MKRSSRDWPSLLKEFSESGLSQKAFCELKQVSPNTLGYWLKKSRGNGRAARARRNFIELDLAAMSQEDRSRGSEGEIVVELPLGVVIRVRPSAR